MTTQPQGQGLNLEVILPIFILVFVDVLGLTVILPLLHLYSAQFGAGPLEIAFVAAAFPLAQLFGVPMMGALSDRFGRKPLLLISQITTCLSFVLLALANSITLIIISRLIDGIFGANIATAQAALSDVTDDDSRAQGLGLTGAAFGLGFIFGPIIAILSLELTNELSVPALSAATYSLVSIFITLFFFKETLTPDKRRRSRKQVFGPLVIIRMLFNTKINLLLILMFAQQAAFFAFESLMGLFVLSRLGLLGQATSFLFIFIGSILVVVQLRFIGKWTRRYGEAKVILFALLLMGVGMLGFGFTPEQPHPFYRQQIATYRLLDEQTTSSTEAILGELQVPLPPDGQNGIGGVLWVTIIVIPLTVGAGLIRPSLNSLMTKRVPKEDYGAVLGVSSSFVSAANAIAPLSAGFLFQHYGAPIPFIAGGMFLLFLMLISTGLIGRTTSPVIA